MNLQQVAAAVDEIAVRTPERGCGYADSQRAWRHDAAIEQVRRTFHEFLAEVGARGRRRTIVQLGLGRHGGSHRALRTVAEVVVTVERDASRVAAFAAATAADPARDLVVLGDSADPRTIAAVAAAAPTCDGLLLDAADDYETMREDWVHYAGLVAPGGFVAIGDRSQAYPEERHSFEVDRFVDDLQRDFLAPRGVRCRRFGGAHAIHVYTQNVATQTVVEAPPWPAGFVPTPAPVPTGQVGGFSTWSWRGRDFAIPGAAGPFCRRRLRQNDFDVVLVGSPHAELPELVAAWHVAEPELAAARDRLLAGQDPAAAAIARQVASRFPALRAALFTALEAAPWNRRLLLAQGTLCLFGATPREGAALLRRVLECDPVDAVLLQTVAAAYLRVLQDEAGARDLLGAARRHVRQRKVASFCHTQLRGHALWHYPQLLAPVHSVVQVGAHRGEDVDAWCQLEIPQQTYVEANPAAFAELDRKCRTAGYGRPQALLAAVGAHSGPATLRFGADTARGSLLPLHALASVPAADIQQHAVPVAQTTLDELVAQGRIRPDACDLLFVDTEGTELDVLRGATALLRSVDVLCVAVFVAPVYDGAPLPQAIQSFLFDLHDGDGFVLCAFEPGSDPARGQAVFRRRQPRDGK